MTTEERQEYNKLPKNARDNYDYIKRNYPNWSHSQIMTKLAFDGEVGKIIGKGGSDINPKDPSILKMILEGAKEILKKWKILNFKIKEIIDDTISYLSDQIKKGITYLSDILWGPIKWLFS